MTPMTMTGAGPEYRAAGTDLSERRRTGLSRGALVDIAPTAEMRAITWESDGSVRIGASVTIAAMAADQRLAQGYPALTTSAAGLATPQIRALATLGGNIAQRTRCSYYRNTDLACLKKGSVICSAREGNHRYGVAFDVGPCVAPHASTMAAALLAYDAKITTDRRTGLMMGEVLGDGSDGTRDHQLGEGELITAVTLGAAVQGERGAYRRAISRTYAEWPLVEIVARGVVADGMFRMVRLAAGGVAPVPLRLAAAEETAAGKPATAATIAEAARQTTHGAKPLAMTGYKLALLEGLVRDLLGTLAGLA